MRKIAGITLLLSLAMLWGCSHTVLVPVPPRMDLKSYGTLGIVEFSSNADPAINAHATRQFQEQIQAAQPGTPFVDLGNRDAVLAAVGGRQLDVDTLKKIGAKYGVAAIFLGDIAYSEPKTDVNSTISPSSKAACVQRSGATFPAGWWTRAPAPACGAVRLGRRGRPAASACRPSRA